MASSVDRHLLERWSDSLAYSMTSRVVVVMRRLSLVSLRVSRSLGQESQHTSPQCFCVSICTFVLAKQVNRVPSSL